jgi:hypothetical protein
VLLYLLNYKYRTSQWVLFLDQPLCALP